MSIFFTADQHFSHGLLAQIRGFSDIDSMDRALIKAWNDRVKPKDTIYSIGDFTLENPIHACVLLRQLNGRIKIVPADPGHDHWIDGPFDFQEPFEGKPGLPEHVEILPPIVTIKVPKVETGTGTSRNEIICLCHYPLKTWDRSHYGSWHLHGHSHGKMGIMTSKYSLDVGVDNCTDLAPVSAVRIGEVMTNAETYMAMSGWKL